MSLIADLLSKVKHEGIKRDVPPNLKQVVEDSTEKAAIKKKVIILSALLLAAVITGFGAVYFIETFMQPVTVTGPVRPHPLSAQKQTISPAPAPVPPAPSPEAQVPESPKPSPEKKFVRRHKPALALSGKSYKSGPALDTPVNPPAPPENSPLPGHLTREQSEARDMHLYAAKTYESKKDYQQALSNYKDALQLEPDNYLIMNNISGVMLRIGRYNDALLYARNALMHNNNYVPAIINTGIASIELNNPAEGQKYLAKALSLDPSNRGAMLNLAIVNEKTGEYDKAHAYFYKLAELGDVQGYLGLAREAERNSKYANAASIYREILSMNNVDPKIRKLADERLQAIGDRQ